MHFLQPGPVSRAYTYTRWEYIYVTYVQVFFFLDVVVVNTDRCSVCVRIWLLFYLWCCFWLMGWVSILCVNTMLNVVPATQTIRERHFLAVDNNKPREAPARPTNANSSSQGAAPAGGNNQNQKQPPPNLVCHLLLYFGSLSKVSSLHRRPLLS